MSGGRDRPVRILAVAGSLRRDSHNRALLRAAARLISDPVTVEVFDGLDLVPVFNEDLEGDSHEVPGVDALRRALRRSDGLLIATPEYNQSVPGVTKNMIDWLSRGDGLSGRPVAVIGASTGPWGTRIAQTILRQMLLSVQAAVMPHPTLFVPDVESLLDSEGELADPQTAKRLQLVVSSFVDWIRLFSPPEHITEPDHLSGLREPGSPLSASPERP